MRSFFASVASYLAALLLLVACLPTTESGKIVYCKVNTNYEERYKKNETAAPVTAVRQYKTLDLPPPCIPAIISDAADPEVEPEEFHSLLATQLWNRPRYQFVKDDMPELDVLQRDSGVIAYWDCVYYHPMYYALKHLGPARLQERTKRHPSRKNAVQALADAGEAGTGSAAAGTSAGMYVGPRMAWLDFGVFRGWSVNMTSLMLQRSPVTVHGFDTWEGLPEQWQGHMGAGQFSTGGVLPLVRAGVHLHKGFFNETLPRWLKANPSTPIYGISVDCDLYNGSMDVLTLLGPLLQRGSIIHFHELRHKEEGGQVMEEARALRDWLKTMPPSFRMRLVPMQDASVAEPAVFVVTHL